MSTLSKKWLPCVATIAFGVSSIASAESLKEVLDHTLSTNPDIQVTTKVRNASNQEVRQARSGYFPQVDMNALYGRERSDNSNTGFEPKTLWRENFGISAKQMLFDGFQTKYEVARTKAKTNADAYKVAGTSEDVGLSVVQAYLDVLRNQELVGIARRNLAVHESTYSKIKASSDQGVAREADTEQTLGRVELARANLVSAQNGLDDAKINFLKITGMNPIDLVKPPVVPNSMIPKNETSAVQMALENHPTLKSANADISEARGQFNASKAAFYPRLDLVLEANHDHNVSGIEGHSRNQLAALQLQYNLFRGGHDDARARQTAFQVEEACEIRNRTHRQVIDSMKLSWAAYRNSTKRLPYVMAHRDASVVTTGAYQKQFELGKRTILDVLDSQNELYTSQQNIVNERYALLFSKYRILNSMGKLVEFFNLPMPAEATVPYAESELS